MSVTLLPSASTPWRPILSGVDGAKARDIAQSIVGQLRAELSRRPREETSWRLVNGLAGFALLFDYAKRCGLDVPSDLAIELIQDGIECANPDPDPSLYFGLAGLCWSGQVTHAWATLGDEVADRFDHELKVLLSSPLPPFAHSLFRGVAGLGVYALRRICTTGPDNAAAIVQRLRESALRDANGVSWPTDSRSMHSPGGGATWFSMGMPQGLLSTICFLASATREKISGADDLLYAAGTWLNAQRMSAKPGQCFPVCIDGTTRIPADRLGWCNGDLPVALTLIQAGIAGDRRSWVDAAIDVALMAASIREHETLECSLCHGDAGIGFSFLFLYNLTEEPAFREASAYWFTRTLGCRVPGKSYEGFRTLLGPPADASHQSRRTVSYSGQFLRGAGGIALALLAASEPQSPEWAEALMLPWAKLQSR